MWFAGIELFQYIIWFVLTYVDPQSTTVPESLSTTSRWRPFVAIGQCSVHKINGKFSKLVTESCKMLQKKDITVKDFQLFVVTMCSSHSSKDGSDMDATKVENAKSLDEIFLALSKNGFWDYLNYYPLQSVIEQFASDDNELWRMMEQYQKDLSGHALALEIQRCLYLDATHHVQISPAFPPPTHVTTHSFSYVKELWQSLENQFSTIPKLETILHDIPKIAYTSPDTFDQPSKLDHKSGTKSQTYQSTSEGNAGGAVPLSPSHSTEI